MKNYVTLYIYDDELKDIFEFDISKILLQKTLIQLFQDNLKQKDRFERFALNQLVDDIKNDDLEKDLPWIHEVAQDFIKDLLEYDTIKEAYDKAKFNYLEELK